MLATIDYLQRRQRKQRQPARMSFAMFRATNRFNGGRTGYVVMSTHGVVCNPLEYNRTTALHRCEIVAIDGDRVQLRRRGVDAWWRFTGDEMVVIEYAERSAA